MSIVIALVLVASFIFAISCGVILLVRLGEFLLSYYGAIIFVVPFAVSVTLSVLSLIFYLIGQRKRKIDAISKLKEISEVMEKHKKEKENEKNSV